MKSMMDEALVALVLPPMISALKESAKKFALTVHLATSWGELLHLASCHAGYVVVDTAGDPLYRPSADAVRHLASTSPAHVLCIGGSVEQCIAFSAAGAVLSIDDARRDHFLPWLHAYLAHDRVHVVPTSQGLDLILDIDRSRFRVEGGGWVTLSTTEFAVLRALSERRGRVCSKRDLSSRAWGSPVAHNVVEQSICRLRRKLVALDCHDLVTVRGLGYVLESSEVGEESRPARFAPSHEEKQHA